MKDYLVCLYPTRFFLNKNEIYLHSFFLFSFIFGRLFHAAWKFGRVSVYDPRRRRTCQVLWEVHTILLNRKGSWQSYKQGNMWLRPGGAGWCAFSWLQRKITGQYHSRVDKIAGTQSHGCCFWKCKENRIIFLWSTIFSFSWNPKGSKKDRKAEKRKERGFFLFPLILSSLSTFLPSKSLFALNDFFPSLGEKERGRKKEVVLSFSPFHFLPMKKKKKKEKKINFFFLLKHVYSLLYRCSFFSQFPFFSMAARPCMSGWARRALELSLFPPLFLPFFSIHTQTAQSNQRDPFFSFSLFLPTFGHGKQLQNSMLTWKKKWPK